MRGTAPKKCGTEQAMTTMVFFPGVELAGMLGKKPVERKRKRERLGDEGANAFSGCASPY